MWGISIDVETLTNGKVELYQRIGCLGQVHIHTAALQEWNTEGSTLQTLDSDPVQIQRFWGWGEKPRPEKQAKRMQQMAKNQIGKKSEVDKIEEHKG